MIATTGTIIRFARDRGILCQGRGSAANSAVCYVLGITAVDPGKHELLFERFVSASRGEPPDIDIDFEHERREEVIQHLYDRYSRERAAICATVIRYRILRRQRHHRIGQRSLVRPHHPHLALRRPRLAQRAAGTTLGHPEHRLHMPYPSPAALRA